MVKFQFSYLLGGTGTEIIKSYTSIKLTRSKPFRVYLIERTLLKRGKANAATPEPKRLLIN